MDQAHEVHRFSHSLMARHHYSCIIGKNQLIRYIIEDAQTRIDFSILDRAVANHKTESMTKLLDKASEIPVDVYESLIPQAVLVDVRHPDEAQNRPVPQYAHLDNEIVRMPYFRIQKDFAETDSKKHYLLYCDRGVMSRLHAEMLLESGYQNVGVYRPKKS